MNNLFKTSPKFLRFNVSTGIISLLTKSNNFVLIFSPFFSVILIATDLYILFNVLIVALMAQYEKLFRI